MVVADEPMRPYAKASLLYLTHLTPQKPKRKDQEAILLAWNLAGQVVVHLCKARQQYTASSTKAREHCPNPCPHNREGCSPPH